MTAPDPALNKGYLACMVFNFGMPSKRDAVDRLRNEIIASPAGVFIVQETPPKDAFPDCSVAISPEIGGTTVAVRRSVGVVELFDDYSRVDGTYSKSKCHTGLTLARLRFPQPRAGFETLWVASVHLHRGLAKRAGGCGKAADNFWDDLAGLTTDHTPLLLGGDWNRAVDNVAEQLQRRQPTLRVASLAAPGPYSQECLSLLYCYFDDQQGPPDSDVKPYSYFDEHRLLWTHGAHWPVLTYLSYPGAQRTRTKAGAAKRAEHKKRKREEKQATAAATAKAKLGPRPPASPPPPAAYHEEAARDDSRSRSPDRPLPKLTPGPGGRPRPKTRASAGSRDPAPPEPEEEEPEEEEPPPPLLPTRPKVPAPPPRYQASAGTARVRGTSSKAPPSRRPR